jgi:hypothetical protein
VEPDLQVGQAGGGADQLGDPMVGEALQRVLVGTVAGAEHPAQPGVVVGHQDGPGAGPFQVGDGHRPAAEGRVQVGLDQGGDGVEQRAGAVDADAEPLPDRAAGAVGGDQVVGPDGPRAAVGPVGDGRGDPLVVLLEGGQLGREPHLGAQLLGPGSQQDLQLVLVDGGEPARAGVAGPLVLALLLGRGVLQAGQRLGPGRHPPVVAVAGEAGRADGRLQANLAVDLDGPGGDPAQPRVDQQPRVPLHDQARHPVPGQEHGAGQPGQRTPHHQHRGSFLCHRSSSPASFRGAYGRPSGAGIGHRIAQTTGHAGFRVAGSPGWR